MGGGGGAGVSNDWCISMKLQTVAEEPENTASTERDER